MLLRIAAVISGISFGGLSLTGCSNNELPPSQEIPLKPEGTVEALDGDTFLENVHAMQQYGDALYLSGKGYPFIFVLDHEFRIIRTIGRHGKGPGEFSYAPFSSHVSGNRIYSYNSTSRQIQIFSLKGDYLKSIPLDPRHYIWYHGLTMDKQENLYVTPSLSKNPYSIVKLDSSGTVLKTFGDLLETSYSELRNYQMSSRIIISVDDESLIAIGEHVPVVEKYSLEGELLQSKDLSDSPYFTERLEFAKEFYAGGGTSTASMLSTIDAFNSRLYILPIVGELGDHQVHRILELDPESLDIVRTYALLDFQGDPLRWVSTFEFISENELVAFNNPESVFYRYRIDS